jgi:PAS domain S-box-containing protein
MAENKTSSGKNVAQSGRENSSMKFGTKSEEKPADDSKEADESNAADAELRMEKERTLAILKAAADAIVTIDRAGIIISINPATERIFGYAESELLGQNVSILMPPPYREQHDAYLEQYQKTGEAHIIDSGREVTGQRKDGSTFPADLAVSEVDHLGFYTGIIRDISLRKQVEEQARREHEFVESLIETTQNIILVLDCEGRVVRYNSVFEGISGRSLEDVEGLDWFETFLPESDQSRIRKLFLQNGLFESVRGNINPIVTKSGHQREIEWYSAPLREQDGSVIGVVCSGTDVTDRLRLEQEVYRVSEEEKVRIAQDLHDGLGSLLTGIGYLAGALSANLRHGKTIEAKDTDLIVDSINDAINQTRALAHGLHGISDQPNALPAALRTLAATVRRTSGLKCRLKVPDSDIGFSDLIAANHIFRIAQEAINNALRHSDATCLTVEIRKTGDGEGILKILDNGKGFDVATSSDRGLGLNTMAYRARAIGARLGIRRRRKGGTRVECAFAVA